MVLQFPPPFSNKRARWPPPNPPPHKLRFLPPSQPRDSSQFFVLSHMMILVSLQTADPLSSWIAWLELHVPHVGPVRSCREAGGIQRCRGQHFFSLNHEESRRNIYRRVIAFPSGFYSFFFFKQAKWQSWVFTTQERKKERVAELGHGWRRYSQILGTPESKKSHYHSGTSPMRPNQLWICPDTEPPGFCPWWSMALVVGLF